MVTLIVLAMLELAFRLFHDREGAEVDALGEPIDFKRHSLIHQPASVRELIYELKPGAVINIQGRENRINAHGMRDREYTQTKNPGVFRIAVLGDSFTFGWRVKLEECYVKQLERLLNEGAESTRQVEVLNFGVCAYNSRQEMIVLERKALSFEPDLVIVGFVTNDILLPASPLAVYFTRRDELSRQRLDRAVATMEEHLPRAAADILPNWLACSSLACFVFQSIEEARRGDFIANYYGDEEMWTELTHSLRDMKNCLSRLEIPLFVAVFPDDVRVLSRPACDEIHEKVCTALGELAVPFVDLLQTYRSQPREKIMIDALDPHPGAYGHAIAARAIHQALVTKELVPRL